MKIPSRARSERGAAAVEFAIIAPLLFMLIFGMLQYGLAFFQIQNLRSAAREGARVAAVRGTPADVSLAISDASTGSLSYPSGGTWAYSQPVTCADATSGDPVTLTLTTLPAAVQASFAINIPFLPPFNLTPTISGSFRCE